MDYKLLLRNQKYQCLKFPSFESCVISKRKQKRTDQQIAFRNLEVLFETDPNDSHF